MLYSRNAAAVPGPQVYPASKERVGRLFDQMCERDSWPRERLLEYQRERLNEIVQHAVARAPYYREVIGDKANHPIDLQALPVLTKRTLMAQFDRMVTDPRLRLADVEQHLAGEQAGEPLFGEYRVFGSGGTTGERGIITYDQSAWEVAVAGLRRGMNVQGVSPQDRVVGIGSPSPLHATNRLFAELRADRSDVPRLDVTMPLPRIVEALNAFQPDVLITYPSLIRQLAEEQLVGRLEIMPHKLSSAAETLTPEIRELARLAWDAPVLNVYGATEMNAIAIECPWTTGLHVTEDLLVVEVVDEHNRPVSAGMPGHKVLMTNLFNRAQPLIRYEFSDIVTVAEGSCPCGRPHLRLASIQGRQEDVLRLPARDGGEVTVHGLRLAEPLERMSEVRQFQVSPRPPAGLLVRLALRDAVHMDDVLRTARQAIAAALDHAGAAVETLVVEAVDDIARTGTGAKQKLVGGSG